MVLIEPILLSTWGSTPGKWIFGLVLRAPGRGKAHLGAGARRTWGVFRRGLGWGIPIYEIVRLVKCCMACSRGEAMAWEEELDWDAEDQYYTIRDERGLRCAGFVGAQAAVWAALFLVVAQAYLPIHRGAGITAAQYAANVNDMHRFLGSSPAMVMDEGGRWGRDAGGVDWYMGGTTDGAPPRPPAHSGRERHGHRGEAGGGSHGVGRAHRPRLPAAAGRHFLCRRLRGV